MQTLMLNIPQPLRAKLQSYQNEHNIDQPDAAVIAILQIYFQTWTPSKTKPLPAMYDADDGPCEVISSFLES
ncbi:hypothetical protein BH23CYA1_BH23CYA1_18680 [soil metagenome]